MAVGDMLVIDAVAHAVDNSYEQLNANRYARDVILTDREAQFAMMPHEWVIDEERYFQKFPPDGLLSALFMESQIDIACYHAVPMYGIFSDYSPLRVGQEMKRQFPHRVLLYGPLSTFYGLEATLEELERLVVDEKVDGIKFYPWDMVDGKSRAMSLADEENLYPVFQKCLDLGVKVVAIHKTMPLGVAPMDPYRVGDIDYAARDFPDLQFEIVHTGLAFLEESSLQLARYPNVWANLEVTALYAIKLKRKFAQIMAELLLAGAEDRMLFASGCSWVHPRPIIDAVIDFQMPAELVEGGYPDFTDEAKRKMLGLNFARLHNLDLDDLRTKIANDSIEKEKVANGFKAPWSGTSYPSSTPAATLQA